VASWAAFSLILTNHSTTTFGCAEYSQTTLFRDGILLLAEILFSRPNQTSCI
jgi:hypothetical protein